MSNDTREALAAAIVNLGCCPERGRGPSYALGYRNGHRDARHAAAELVGAALTEQPAAPDLMTVVGHILDAGHLNTEDLGRLRAAWERAVPAAAPQGDSVERCGEPSGAVSGGSGIGASEADDEFPTWVLLLRPGFAPQRKGPFHRDECVASMIRDCARIYPDSTTVVLDGPATMYPVSGGEWLSSRELEREAPAARTETGASVAAPQARPDQQSDSCAAPQGVPAEPILRARFDAWCKTAPDFAPEFAQHREWAERFAWFAVRDLAASTAAPAQEPQQPATREARLRAAMDRMDREGPLPGMISAFETEFGGDWTDPSWRQETAIWAAAWRRAASSPAPAVRPTSEAVAELVEALTRVLRDFPTDADMWQAGWSGEDVARACDAYDHAKAVITKHGKPQGGSNV